MGIRVRTRKGRKWVRRLLESIGGSEGSFSLLLATYRALELTFCCVIMKRKLESSDSWYILSLFIFWSPG